MRALLRVLATAVILGVAGVVLLLLWRHYTADPWTRDGDVRVQVANIAPQVSGQIVAVRVRDNQYVREGDVLYEIDPFDFQVAVAQAEANLRGRDAARRNTATQSARRRELTTLSTSVEEKQNFASNADESAASFAQALAQQSQARINLQRTRVVSTVNGYVNNLLMRVGDYATEGRANIQVVDADSFWVDGYMEETKLGPIRVGDPATVVLMGYRAPIAGHVRSITRGISTPNAAPATQGLPSVNPVYTWVRLAQRIPVEIAIDRVPPGVVLAAGMTATVSVHPRQPLPVRDDPAFGAPLLGWLHARLFPGPGTATGADRPPAVP